MNVLGFSGIKSGKYYEQNYGIRFVGHDSAVALIRDGKLLFAVEEERLSREKHTSKLPVRAIQWALDSAGMTLKDIDASVTPGTLRLFVSCICICIIRFEFRFGIGSHWDGRGAKYCVI